MPSNANSWCVAPGCTSDDRKRGKYGFMTGVEFFPFPLKSKDPKMRKKWLELLRRENYDPKPKHRLCSLHFVDGKPTVSHPYPELFAYNNFKECQLTRSTAAIDKRSNTLCKAAEIEKSVHYENESLVLVSDQPCPMEIADASLYGEVFYNVPFTKEETVTGDKETMNRCIPGEKLLVDHEYITTSCTTIFTNALQDAQTQTDLSSEDIKTKDDHIQELEDKLNRKDDLMRELFVHKITETDTKVRSYLGLPSGMALFGIFAILDKTSPVLKYWRGRGGTHHQTWYQNHAGKQKTGPKRRLSRFHEFLITLLKMKLDLHSYMLADIFGISNTRVSQIFTTWVNYMHIIFSPLLKWPNSDRIKKFMPRCYKNAFPNTTCIIDCTEFFIAKPGSPTAQSQTYSSYKHKNTFKALVAISPTGAFIFVSNLWGGNVSDRFLTEKSGFLDFIKPGNEVMADRGFIIRDLLLERRATLNIPPFTKKCSWGKGKILSTTAIKRTKNIAKLRIHVERAIGRLKNYQILSNTMSLSMKPLANQILKICAFLCNLQSPLVKN